MRNWLLRRQFQGETAATAICTRHVICVELVKLVFTIRVSID